jgi:hypothetical protein
MLKNYLGRKYKFGTILKRHEIWKTKIKKKVNNIQVLKIYNVYTGEYYFEYESSCIFWGVCYTYYSQRTNDFAISS